MGARFVEAPTHDLMLDLIKSHHLASNNPGRSRPDSWWFGSEAKELSGKG
jgi:hypothetical protein